MPIPPQFNEVEQLQMLTRRFANKAVREDFRDLGGDDWNPDVSTIRGAMRWALTHKDNDPINVTLLRLFLYYFTYGKARSLQPPIYGIPVQDFQETFSHHPQIKLFFMEDAEDVDDDYYPIRSEITFRLINETESTITEANARALAQRIDTAFGTNKGFRWKRGRETWMYVDLRRGYRLKLFVWDETEAKRVIEQVLDIQGHTPDWDEHLKDATNRKDLRTSIVPKTKRIYGKNRKLPRVKPVGHVRFRWAELSVWGLVNPITLVDKSGRRRRALIAA